MATRTAAKGQPTPSDAAGPPSWRDKQRQHTVAEIIRTGRQLLVDEGETGVSLRAIAREMGMTAPALYRYFGSHHDLISALTVDIYEDLIAFMEQARDAQAPDDVAAQLVSVCHAFRTWSLGHRGEFGLVFANPIMIELEEGNEEVELAGHRFGLVFGAPFAQLLQRPDFPNPPESELDPSIVEQLKGVNPMLRDILPTGALYEFVRSWVRVYGAVTLEVFGHCHWALQDCGPLFDDVLRECARSLHMEDEFDDVLARLR